MHLIGNQLPTSFGKKNIKMYNINSRIWPAVFLFLYIFFYIFQETNSYHHNNYVYRECSYNLTERVVKPFVIAIKSFLFCKTADGAITTGKLFSIVQKTRAN